MKNRYRLVKRGERGGTLYAFDTQFRKRSTLETADPQQAKRIINAMNEARVLPAIKLYIARAYLMAGDDGIKTRTWQHVMQEMVATKKGETKTRFERAMDDAAFNLIRNLVVIETRAEQFFKVLQEGTVSTNVLLRRIHNFAVAMNWLPCALIPQNRWPPVLYGDSRNVCACQGRSLLQLFWVDQPIEYRAGGRRHLKLVGARDTDRIRDRHPVRTT